MKLRAIAAYGLFFLPWAAFAVAPVVDESDNFATYENQQAADEQPLAKEGVSRVPRDVQDNDDVDTQPLARESMRGNTGNNVSLLNQVQNLQKDIQELRGQVEVQAHEIKVLKAQQLAFYKDIDERLHQPTSSVKPAATPIVPQTLPPEVPHAPVNGAVSAATIPALAEKQRSNNPAEEQIHYLAAYDLIKNKRFSDASTAMESFAAQYPKGGYTANAHYWLGELYMSEQNYLKAIVHFDIVLQQFPASSKAASSLLKSAYALTALGKKQEAATRLKQVIKNYPDTHTAQLAEEKLKSLGQ